MPYKLHLTVNVLKEIYIYFFLVLYITYQNTYTLLISLLFGTSLRTMFGLYFLNLIILNKFSKTNWILLITIVLVFLLIGFK